MVWRKEVLFKSINYIETYIDMVVYIIGLHNSVPFELCIDEDLIKIWWSDIMFDSPNSTKFQRISTSQWLIFFVIWDHSVRILGLWQVHLFWDYGRCRNQQIQGRISIMVWICKMWEVYQTRAQKIITNAVGWKYAQKRTTNYVRYDNAQKG